jgi:signal recognition particle subunit SEC65
LRSRSENHVLWPAYFDIRRSRAGGRMVSRKLAVEEPTCDEILAAAKACGFEGAVDAEAAYPGEWHKAGGRVHVVRQGPKRELLSKVSGELRRMRQK